jgi:hypothetical protein
VTTPDINAGTWYLQAVGERAWDVCEPTTGAVVAQVTATGDPAAAAAGTEAVRRFLLQLVAQPGQ